MGWGVWLLFGGGQEVQKQTGALKGASLLWPPGKGRAGIDSVQRAGQSLALSGHFRGGSQKYLILSSVVDCGVEREGTQVPSHSCVASPAHPSSGMGR